MHYSDPIDKSKEFSNAALKRISDYDLPHTPEIYELWYVYCSQFDSEVVRAMDLLLASNDGSIDKEQCQELHLRFLSDAKESERVRVAGDTIQETITGVSGAVQDVKNATEQYNGKLAAVNEQFLTNKLTKEDMQKAVSAVMSDTQDIISKNKLLEEELNKSSSVMLELKRDLEKVRKEALTDGLTNLANRKAFDTEIMRIAAESKDDKSKFSLLLMDIDHFKSFNDNYGHQVGDQVLRLVARTLTDGVKGRDIACRYGGEEFAVLLPETELAGALKVGEILRNAVATKDIINRNSGEKMGRITLSGGIAEFVESESIEDLIARADTALYTAKHNGRNQIAAASAPKHK